MKKIIYMGTPHYAKEILDAILETKEYEVSLVITQPDRPVGRKKVLTPPPVKELALKHEIEVLQPQNLKAQETQEAIEALKPDYIIVAAFGQILPKSILDIAPCINLHASILPQYRGASPVQQSLLNNDTYSGVTAMLMDVGLDTGDILGFQYFKIPSDIRLHGLMEQLTCDATKLTLDILARFDEIRPLSQLDVEATLCKKIKREDGEINFQNAQILYNQYRAYEGWPNVFTNNKLKLLDMELLECDSINQEGEILDICDDGLIVGCAKGRVLIKEVQPNSKRAMDVKSYSVGRGIKVGDSII